ncbi:hypothetical protein FNF31_05387 [Cafeteria roenbergensis]|uniref:Selenoprotein F/M domain-containing protein n=1 Tax=Cafeteria roenbergensis TaxID=33653 RepID=A0A5A8D3Q0_CAFRO|nr:hypothetical protein FNF31_05387 [Cafeteria roenbergensis]KAA0163952.1 hypothetical protein FNF28_04057 [Cafeteria roenbergensis]
MRVSAFLVAFAGLLAASATAYFEEMEQASPRCSATPAKFQAKSAILRAPVHTCVIKYYPGLKAFVRQDAPTYKGSRLEVQAFSQPPSFIFYSADGETTERIKVPNEATNEEIKQLLSRWGIRPGSGSQEPTEVSECGADDEL